MNQSMEDSRSGARWNSQLRPSVQVIKKTHSLDQKVVMRSPKRSGRIIGILLLAHLITGLTTPYIILLPLNTPLTFAANEPSNSFRVRLAVMLLFVGGAVTIAIAA